METNNMATVQTDGFSPVTQQSTANNSGTIKANGNTSGTFEKSGTSLPFVGVFGSTVVDNNDTDPALSVGTFAYNNQKPISKKLTDTLSGVPNDFMLSGAGDPANIQSIHKIESIVTRKLTTAIRQNKWNEYSGEFDPGYPEVVRSVFGNDDAARPSSESPGELTYRDGSPLPVNDDYQKKTVF
jgi:hypothetical protein